MGGGRSGDRATRAILPQLVCSPPSAVRRRGRCPRSRRRGPVVDILELDFPQRKQRVVDLAELILRSKRRQGAQAHRAGFSVSASWSRTWIPPVQTRCSEEHRPVPTLSWPGGIYHSQTHPIANWNPVHKRGVDPTGSHLPKPFLVAVTGAVGPGDSHKG